MECSKCEKKFRDAYALRRHQTRKTPCTPILDTGAVDAAKAHICKYCGRDFATRPSLVRHMRQYCKIANSEEGMEKLMEHTLQRQMQTLQDQVGRLTQLMEKQLTVGPCTSIVNAEAVAGAGHVTNIDARTTTNIQINVVGFDREDRIRIPVSLVKAAFTENPRLIEYCRMNDDERTNADKAAPYVLEALVDLVRRAHKDPVYRNIYLNPKRADQVMVCLDDDEREKPQRSTPQRWEVRSLFEAIRLLFDGVAENLHRIVISDQDRAQLPFDVQSAASWVPNLYGDEPERFVKDGRAPMAAHLANTRPPTGHN